MQRKYTLERIRDQSAGREKQTLQRHRSVELAEALAGLWIATQDYQPTQVMRIPGYLKLRVKWHMGDQFKAVSTETLNETAEAQSRRSLKFDTERSGGELDVPLDKYSDTDSVQRAATLRNLNPAE